MSNRAIQAGDAGIWATCSMKKEAKSVADLRDLFQEVSHYLMHQQPHIILSEMLTGGDSTLPKCMGRLNPVKQLQTTILMLRGGISKLRSAKSLPIFAIQLQSHCLHRSSLTLNAVRVLGHVLLPVLTLQVVFFRTRSPLEPVSFVHKICQDIADGAQPRNLSYVKRLTPITATEKATPQGLESVAKQVLAPHFHGPDQTGKKVSLTYWCRMTHHLYTKLLANVG